VFLYKFMNDKFGYDLKSIDDRFNVAESWEKVVADLPDATFAKAVLKLAPSTAKLKKEHLLSYLYNKQNTKNFSKLFDSTLIDISQSNASIFSVSTASNAKIVLFDELSQFISDPSQRDEFCKAIINQLVNFSFEEIFTQKFDFFATIFEYLIKDYNKDGGGKYAEYYTPHAVSKIMSKILVTTPASNVTVYDPSAGSGTLLMNVAHEIGEANCTIYSQDISQKSTGMLRLNLILNNLVHSIQNIVQGNTLEKPAFKEGGSLKKFDYIVSNPPFKLDFSESRDNLDTPVNSERFFAGIPTVPNKKKDSMAIYLLFVQHIIFSLSPKGKAAIVVPTGFLTAENSIVSAIRKKIIEMEILTGVISMPSNIFATTGTNVSVLILDRKHVGKSAILMDATELGSVVKEGKAQKTVLSDADNQLIIDTFNKRQNVEHFAHLVDFEKIVSKNYSFSPSQYASSWDASTIARGTSQESLELEISETLKEYKELDDENLRLQKSLAKTLKDLGYDL